MLEPLKKSFKNFMRAHPFTRKIYDSYVERGCIRRYNKYCRENDVNEKMIIFEAFMGDKYADSPREIYEAMIQDDRFKDFTFIWAFKKKRDKKNIPALRKATLVTYKSYDYYMYYALAKYFVSNSRIDTIITKREGQVYIQTWHGTPLKKLGYDIPVGDNALHSQDELCELYKLDAERYDYLLSPSAFTTEKFSSAFNLEENNPDVKIIEGGYPRNDYLVTFTDYDVYYAKKSLGIEKINKKVILYAPTWRDNQYTYGVGYELALPIDFDKLQRELGDEYIILFRAHYFVARNFDFSAYPDFIIDVSSYENINDLYIAADILVTDYSSVFFDYSILKRPIIFYMYDLADYQEELRGFYISLDELPGPIVQTEDELIEAVHSDFVYDEKYRAFNERFTSREDGHASQRALEQCIIPEIKEKTENDVGESG